MILFEEIIDLILEHEGGYVNHPSDPGGETKFGISKRAYPNLDIKTLSKAEAKRIYKRDYWDKMHLDDFKDSLVQAHVFDHGINAGISRAARILSTVVGREGKDTVMNKSLIERANSLEGLGGIIKGERIKYYETIAKNKPQLKKFLRGWLNRVNKTHESFK